MHDFMNPFQIKILKFKIRLYNIVHFLHLDVKYNDPAFDCFEGYENPYDGFLG